MGFQKTRSGGQGLERSCKPAVTGWLASTTPVEGVELFRASLTGEVYSKHRHDTYAVGVTDRGVQVFDYRGSARQHTRPGGLALYTRGPRRTRARSGRGLVHHHLYRAPVPLRDAPRAARGAASPAVRVRDRLW